MRLIKILTILIACVTFNITNVIAEENPKTIFDENILIDYDIIGSSIIGGSNVWIKNKVDGSAIVVGNNISVDSSIEYAFILGNDIDISGRIKDSIIAGKNIILNESSNIERDTNIYGETVEISGLINRDIVIYAQDVKIDSVQIAGNLKINAKNIIITENAAIMGTLSYNEDAIIDVNKAATVGNTDTFKSNLNKDKKITEIFFEHFSKIISLVLIFLVSLFIFPKFFTNIEHKEKDLVKSMGYGIIYLIVVPIISFILLFTIFGLPLGILLLIIYVITLLFSTIISGYLLGYVIKKKILKKNITPYLIGVIGISSLYILESLPYIGTAILFISIIISNGTLLQIIKSSKNN